MNVIREEDMPSFGTKFFSLILLAAFLPGCKSVQTKIEGPQLMQTSYQKPIDLSGDELLPRCLEHLNAVALLEQQLIKEATAENFLSTLDKYNEILIHLDSAMSQASLMGQVHPSEKVRKDADICEQKASSVATNMSLNKELYLALKLGESVDLPTDAKRLLEHTLRDFRRSGVDKDDATRDKIKALREELVKIGQDFSQNIREERLTIELDGVADLKGLPKDYIESHKPNSKGKIEISTDYPDFVPFMKYAESNDLRQKLRFNYLNRGQKNGEVLRLMIAKRHELATTLGYTSYADYVVEDKMIKEARSIHSFINKIADIAKEGADKEYQAMLSFKKLKDPSATKIEGYESAYLEEAFKKDRFKFDSQEARSYFPYEKVRDGLLTTTGKLFGIRYVVVNDAKVWDPSVNTYDVFDESGKLGRIYLDMHPRDGKYKHAAQFTVQSGLLNRQYPEGALVCNFPDPKNGVALMEHREVVTMFHEFGHLLHHVFAGKHRWIPFSGVATEWDFVEAPSQLLEEWAWSPEVLQSFAINQDTKKAIPKELVEKMRAAEEFGKAIAARQQLFYAALSVDFFEKDPQSFDPLALLQELQAQYSYYPYEKGTHFHYSFGHLEGYSAMYYTYMWSFSIAKDLLKPFKEKGLMNPGIAARYRDIILKQGGAKDAKDLVQEFLGRPFSFDAFEQWLKTDPLATHHS